MKLRLKLRFKNDLGGADMIKAFFELKIALLQMKDDELSKHFNNKTVIQWTDDSRRELYGRMCDLEIEMSSGRAKRLL